MRKVLIASAFVGLITAPVAASELKGPEAPAAGQKNEVSESAPSSSSPLSHEELATISGGQAETLKLEVISAQMLNATVKENSINAGTYQSGQVSFAPNSLNFNGIGNFAINTGANALLQSSLSVIIVNMPPP